MACLHSGAEEETDHEHAALVVIVRARSCRLFITDLHVRELSVYNKGKRETLTLWSSLWLRAQVVYRYLRLWGNICLLERGEVDSLSSFSYSTLHTHPSPYSIFKQLTVREDVENTSGKRRTCTHLVVGADAAQMRKCSEKLLLVIVLDLAYWPTFTTAHKYWEPNQSAGTYKITYFSSSFQYFSQLFSCLSFHLNQPPLPPNPPTPSFRYLSI